MSEMNTNVNDFLRAVDQLNSICKKVKTKGAKDWGNSAWKYRLISLEESEKIINYVNIRNSIARSGASYSINAGDVDFIYRMVKVCSDTAEQFLKSNATSDKRVRIPEGNFRRAPKDGIYKKS